MSITGINRNFVTAGLLVLCQALFMSGGSIIVATSALVAQVIAPMPELSTLPAAMMIVGSTIASIPLGYVMARYSRVTGFMLGALFGITGGAIATIAIYNVSFWWFVIGLFLIGAWVSSAQFYRFAAGEVVPPAYKNRAISWVLLGGIFAAFIGPALATVTRDLVVTAPYMGAYVAHMALVTVAIVFILFMRFSSESTGARAQKESVGVGPALRRARFWAAQSVATFGYMVMAFLMTATPLAMAACDHAFSDSAWVISSHVAAMFLPSFFTGSLIDRFGAGLVMFVGGCLIAVAAAFGLSGIAVSDFWLALVFLGIGWNFAYVGGSCVISEEAALVDTKKLEGLSGFFLMAGVALATSFSGTVFSVLGWTNQLIVAFPFALAICIASVWLFIQENVARRRDLGTIA